MKAAEILFCKLDIINEKKATLTLCFGILAALIHEIHSGLKRWLISKVFVLFSLVSVVIMVWDLKYKAYSLYCAPMLFPLCISVASGSLLHGLLKLCSSGSPPPSYSIHVLHEVVSACVFTWTELGFIAGVMVSLPIIPSVSMEACT